MVISNETQAFILSVVDANQEYNTKLIILFSMLVYSVALFIFTFWIEARDPRWDETTNDFYLSRVILKRAMRWIGGSYIFVFLLMFLLMYRTVPLERLLQLVYTLYIPFFAGFLIFGVMYAWDMVLEFTGIRPNKIRRRRRD